MMISTMIYPKTYLIAKRRAALFPRANHRRKRTQYKQLLKSDQNSDSLSINSMDLKISKVSRCLRTMSKILKILRSLFSNLRNGISTNISNLKLTKKINGLTAALKSIRAKLMQKWLQQSKPLFYSAMSEVWNILLKS